MNRAILMVVGAGVVLAGPLWAGGAQAASYTSVVDFAGDQNRNSVITWRTVSDNNTNWYVGSYDHQVGFAPPAARVDTANLALTYRHVAVNPTAELWWIHGGSTFKKIGQLIGANGNDWTTSEWALPSDLYTNVTGSTWTLGLAFREYTQGQDSFQLDKSVLSGEYTPVPLPGAALLLGSGLAGLALVGRRRGEP